MVYANGNPEDTREFDTLESSRSLDTRYMATYPLKIVLE